MFEFEKAYCKANRNDSKKILQLIPDKTWRPILFSLSFWVLQNIKRMKEFCRYIMIFFYFRNVFTFKFLSSLLRLFCLAFSSTCSKNKLGLPYRMVKVLAEIGEVTNRLKIGRENFFQRLKFRLNPASFWKKIEKNELV